MALFFDGAWFDHRLASLGLTRATLGAALGLPESALEDIWKDQRELSAREVGIIAALLDTTGEDIAHHAGISTPVPRVQARADISAPADVGARIRRIEQALRELTALVHEILGR